MRPSNWENPYEHGITAMEQAREDAFEAGADAILKGLKEDAVYRNYLGRRTAIDDSVISPEVPNKRGWIVLIPEEVDNG